MSSHQQNTLFKQKAFGTIDESIQEDMDDAAFAAQQMRQITEQIVDDDELSIAQVTEQLDELSMHNHRVDNRNKHALMTIKQRSDPMDILN